MKFGNLNFTRVKDSLDLVGDSTREALTDNNLEVLVTEIDPNISDTAVYCERYETSMGTCANCVIVESKRADKVWYAAVLVPGDARADINGVVRRALGARKISFASMDNAVKLTGMEYGAINPIGLPANWPILVDKQIATLPQAIIGSGLRKSKLLISGKLLASLPNAQVIDLAKIAQ